ncbi:MAG: WecB/TagA/CpsF family glycosyltransferase [Ignavibacterium sp.]|nr:WecB/TagA/CpsF family glycosyltransferase [Ignavibacterium sp.]
MDIKSFLNENLILKRELIDLIFEEFCTNSNKNLFTYFNQNSFNIYFSNRLYREALNSFNIYQEGIGMYLALKYLGIEDVDRIDSTEVLYSMFNNIISKGEKVVFIGGKFNEQEILKRSKEKNLKMEIYHSGYFDEKMLENLIQILTNSQAKYILIGMGTPKQEILAYELSRILISKKFICIGNFINYFLGYQKRAPKILRTMQLEWLFRLLQEPRRLFSRYVLGIPLFLFRVLFKIK